MKLYIYNSLTKEKQEFKSINPSVVNMYVCGPTVYDYLHIGNFRGAIFFNLVRNFLEHLKYKVNYAYNFTDVDDKIINRAKELNIPALELSEKFIQEFLFDYNSLKLKPHTYNPKVSQYINEMIKYVQTILDKNLAYIDSGSVYLRRSSLDQVGCLSGRHIEHGLLGEKNHNEHKEHDADFALWKAAKDGEIAWSAPWGSGRPGWHLECSVMIHEIFKTQSLDIHGGGLDLLFPHHENEIYQCKAHGEETLATYWMHNNMLNFGDKKMSKSLGNVLTGRKFISDQSGELLKYVILSHHYRTVIDFSEQSIKEHEKQLAKFYQSIKKAKKLETNSQEEHLFDYLKIKIDAALADDFNTPLAFSYIYEANNFLNKNAKYAKSYLNLISYFGKLFSLFEEDVIEYLTYLDTKELKNLNVTVEEIESAIKKRKEYRDNKQYELADEVRKEMLKKNIALLDYASGTEFEIIRN